MARSSLVWVRRPVNSGSFCFLFAVQNSSWQKSFSHERYNRQSQDLFFHLILHEQRPSNPPVWLSIKDKITLSSKLWISSQVAVTALELVLSLKFFIFFFKRPALEIKPVGTSEHYKHHNKSSSFLPAFHVSTCWSLRQMKKKKHPWQDLNSMLCSGK